jgi:predicted DNA repair protein MutK
LIIPLVVIGAHFATDERVERRLAAVLAQSPHGSDEASKVIKSGEQRHAVVAAAGRHVP